MTPMQIAIISLKVLKIIQDKKANKPITLDHLKGINGDKTDKITVIELIKAVDLDVVSDVIQAILKK